MCDWGVLCLSEKPCRQVVLVGYDLVSTKFVESNQGYLSGQYGTREESEAKQARAERLWLGLGVQIRGQWPKKGGDDPGTPQCSRV